MNSARKKFFPKVHFFLIVLASVHPRHSVQYQIISTVSRYSCPVNIGNLGNSSFYEAGPTADDDICHGLVLCVEFMMASKHWVPLEIELISMVDPKFGKSIIYIESVLSHMDIAVMINLLGKRSIVNKTFNSISNKSISEHISNNVKVLWYYI